MNKKRIRNFLAVLVCLALVFSLAACGGGDSGGSSTPASAPAGSGSSAAAEPEPAAPTETITWNVGTIATDPTVSPDLNSSGDWLEECVELISEYTNGQIELVIHYGGVLGGQPQLFEQCEMGELEVFQGQPMSSNDPRFACWNIPYQFDSLEQINNALDDGNGEIYKMAETWMSEHNMHLLSMGAGFIRGYANTMHEVITPEDVRGIKSRVYEDALVRTFWDGLTQTQMMAVPDIYSALQTGTVDGLEMMATNIVVNKYDEVVKYFTDINWQWVNSQMFVVSDKAWSALTPELQEAVKRATTEANRIQTEHEIQYLEEAMTVLADKGIQVTRLTDEQRQAWKDYAASQTETYKEIIGAEMYDEYMAAVEASKQ